MQWILCLPVCLLLLLLARLLLLLARLQLALCTLLPPNPSHLLILLQRFMRSDVVAVVCSWWHH